MILNYGEDGEVLGEYMNSEAYYRVDQSHQESLKIQGIHPPVTEKA